MIKIGKKVFPVLITLLISSCGLSTLRVSDLDENNKVLVEVNDIKPLLRISSWSRKAVLPYGGMENLFVAYLDDFVYSIGGDDGFAKLPTIYAYDIKKNEWKTKSPLFTARTNSSGAVIDSKIYIVGGFSSTNNYLSSLEVYDPSTDKSDNTKLAMTYSRSGHGAVNIGGKLYVVGGKNDSGFLNSLEIYTPATNTWTLGSQMTFPRTNVGVATVNNKLYAIGGEDQSGFVNAIEEFNPIRNEWKTLETKLIVSRKNFSVATLDGNIFIMGGKDENNNYLDSIEVFNPALNKIQTNPMKLMRPNSSFSSTGVNDTIYLVGGVGTSIFNTLELGKAVVVKE